MRRSRHFAGFASLLVVAWLLAGVHARAQSPDDPDADVEQADDADAADDTDQAAQAEESADDTDDAADTAEREQAAAADRDDDADDDTADDDTADDDTTEDSTAQPADTGNDADDADDTDDDYDDGSSAADEYMAADWAPDVPSNPADDAVPEDTSLDPSGYGWVVVSAPARPSQPGRPGRTQHRTGDFAGPSEILDMRPATKPVRAVPGRTDRHDDDKDTAYSFGGKPIAPGSAPWQAQIYRSLAPARPDVPRWKAQHNCGGTLIAPDWILTAAHCIDDILDDREAGWRVRLGGQDLAKEDGVTYAVDRWVRHSGYKNVGQPAPPKAPIPPPNMYSNDIGLVHIQADAQTRPVGDPKRVHPIMLFRSPVRGGDEVTAIGWGMTGNAAKSFSAVPLKVDLRVMDTPLCQSRPGYGPERVNGSVICAAREGQKTCRGDSGGPVILTNGTTPQLVGLVSWGKADCSGDGRPSVFTRVEKFLPWIDQAMKLPVTRASLP